MRSLKFFKVACTFFSFTYLTLDLKFKLFGLIMHFYISFKTTELFKIQRVLEFIILIVICQAYFSSALSPDFVCSKYCFKSCADYLLLNINEYYACIEANVKCNCSSRLSFNNPIVIAILVAVGVCALILLVCCCRRRIARRRYLRLRTTSATEESAARPFDFASEAMTSTSTTRTPHDESSSLVSRSNLPEKGVTIAGNATIPPASNSLSRVNLPQEYAPPPPYHEVVNVNDATQPNYGT